MYHFTSLAETKYFAQLLHKLSVVYLTQLFQRLVVDLSVSLWVRIPPVP